MPVEVDKTLTPETAALVVLLPAFKALVALDALTPADVLALPRANRDHLRQLCQNIVNLCADVGARAAAFEQAAQSSLEQAGIRSLLIPTEETTRESPDRL